MISLTNVTQYYLEKVNLAKAGTSITRVVKDGENFTPKSADYPFIRVTTMPRESIQEEVGKEGRIAFPGLMRIDLFYSRALNSADEQQLIADRLMNSLLQERQVVRNGNHIVTEGVWTEQLRQQDGNTDLPLFIRWTNFASIKQ